MGWSLECVGCSREAWRTDQRAWDPVPCGFLHDLGALMLTRQKQHLNDIYKADMHIALRAIGEKSYTL